MRERVDRAASRLFDPASTHLRVKICCIASEAEAQLALDAGADALGLVSAMPSGPGPIEDRRIAEITRWVDGRAATVLLTSRQDADAIGRQLDAARPTVVQLTDALVDVEYEKLRHRNADVVLMQVIHVRDRSAIAQAERVAPFVDAILLDSGNPNAAVKELGGTGRVHDWQISRAIRDAIDRPLFLAGGLRPANVSDAVSAVRPFGVDVCSGIRPRGELDPRALREFVAAARMVTGS